MIDRRKFLVGMLGVAAAPMIVRASSLMPIRASRFVGLGYDIKYETIPYLDMDARLQALIRSMEQTKIMIGAQVLNGTYDPRIRYAT